MKWTFLGILFASLGIQGAAAVNAAQDLRTVALRPDLISLGTPRINNRGEVAFTSPVEGVKAEVGGVLTTIVANGDPAPGTTVHFGGFENAFLDDSGMVHIRGTLEGSGVTFGVNERGLWTYSGTQGTLDIRMGDQAPGAGPGVKFRALKAEFDSSTIAFTQDNRISFGGRLTGPGVTTSNDYGFWSEASGSLDLVAREGDPAPGMPAGVVFSRFNGVPQMNAQGATTFRGEVTGPGISGDNFEGIWIGSAHNLQLVAQRGQTAPGLGPQATLSALGFPPLVNNSNQVTFSAFVGGVPDHLYSIWTGAPGDLQLVALDGQQVPGALPGVVTARLYNPLSNGANETAFRAQVTGPGVTTTNDFSIWSKVNGQLRMLAREGDMPPGLLPGNSYSDLESFNTTMALNNAGQLAMHMTYVDPQGDGHRGIWAQNAAGDLVLVVREGQQLEVSPGVFRTIQFLYTDFRDSGLEDGRPSSFNERGQIAFFAGFTDNTSGVFVSDLVAVPEPSTAVLASLGILVLTGRIRRRCRA